MAASKQASKHVHTYVNTLPQCGSASVGLAQARPNQWSISLQLVLSYLMIYE